MAEIDPKVVDSLEKGRGIVQLTGPDGKGIGVFKGPWLDKYYDSYTECLFKNIEKKRIDDNAKQGLNAQGQTKDQELAFKKRQQVSEEMKKRAEVLVTAAGIVK